MKEEEGGIRKNAHPTFFNSNSCDRCSPLAGTTNAFSSIFVLFEFDSICEKRSGWENNFFNSKKKKKEKDVHVYFINIYLRGLLKRELKIFILPGLGRKDSNLRIPGPKPVALPLGDAPFQFRFGTNKEYQWYWLFVNSSPKPQNSILILVLGFWHI